MRQRLTRRHGDEDIAHRSYNRQSVPSLWSVACASLPSPRLGSSPDWSCGPRRLEPKHRRASASTEQNRARPVRAHARDTGAWMRRRLRLRKKPRLQSRAQTAQPVRAVAVPVRVTAALSRRMEAWPPSHLLPPHVPELHRPPPRRPRPCRGRPQVSRHRRGRAGTTIRRTRRRNAKTARTLTRRCIRAPARGTEALRRSSSSLHGAAGGGGTKTATSSCRPHKKAK
jgi:hypothetical protein